MENEIEIEIFQWVIGIRAGTKSTEAESYEDCDQDLGRPVGRKEI